MGVQFWVLSVEPEKYEPYLKNYHQNSRKCDVFRLNFGCRKIRQKDIILEYHNLSYLPNIRINDGFSGFTTNARKLNPVTHIYLILRRVAK